MGLDMYLSKRTYVGNQYKKIEDMVIIKVPKGSNYFIKGDRVSEIVEEVAYWRKANAIHNWFVNNVQGGVDDCGKYYVGKSKLKELVDLCKQLILDKDVAKAEELLPTTPGFLFGSMDYNEWYWSKVEDTVSQLEPLLSEEGEMFYYQSSW